MAITNSPRGPNFRGLRYSSPNGALPLLLKLWQLPIMAITNSSPHPPFLSHFFSFLFTSKRYQFMSKRNKLNGIASDSLGTLKILSLLLNLPTYQINYLPNSSSRL